LSQKIRLAAESGRSVERCRRAAIRALGGSECLLQGTVNVLAPKSPDGKTRYTWTRKVKAKTVTVALSEKQAKAFRKAIEDNRRVETALSLLRETSMAVLLADTTSRGERTRKQNKNGAGKPS
jgi:hypothetical protein